MGIKTSVNFSEFGTDRKPYVTSNYWILAIRTCVVS